MTLCFIAITPDPETSDEVLAFQRYALEHFQSGKALSALPHITLEPPIEFETDQLPALKNCLKSFAEKQDPFPVQLKNFGAFAPRVIFVDVTDNRKLHQLQNHLATCLHSSLELGSNRPDRPFRPHMTVAFRDLRKKAFHNAWEYFRRIEYQSNFVANRICLLQHNGKFWKEHQYFEFK